MKENTIKKSIKCQIFEFASKNVKLYTFNLKKFKSLVNFKKCKRIIYKMLKNVKKYLKINFNIFIYILLFL